MRAAYIVSACRTPIGRFMGALSSLSAVELGTAVVGEAIRRAGLAPEAIDEVIMGNVLSAGLGQNPARQTGLRAGVPPHVAALTINKVCGSGLKAVTLAAQGIQVGDVDVVIAGGMESMTNAPYLLPKGRAGYRMGHGQVIDSLVHDGLWDVFNNFHMGCTAELVSREYSVSREEQDLFARDSHSRAVEAIEAGRFDEEIVAVSIPQKKGSPMDIRQDEGPRPDTSLEALARLKAVFETEGSVTAGNSSQISDGAAALAVVSDEAVERFNCRPLARIVASATSGIEPALLMMAPRDAIRKVLKRSGWTLEDVDLFEINEAFAAQGVALCRELPLDRNRLNVHGGAIALGHPIGASGARVLTTLIYALRQRNLKRGVASLCLGGGNAVAMAIECV